MSNSIFKYPALIGYMIESMSKEYPSKQIGKTIVQKIFYLLTHEGIVKFNYSMYHYGPYSSGVSGELNFAESTGIVDIKWVEDKGYFIYPTEKLKHFESLLNEKEKQAVDGLVKRFGIFNAIELSLIATACYLKENFGISDLELTKVVHNAKPNNSLEYIENVLHRAGILA